MGLCRDMHGRLAYTAVNSDKAVFAIHKGDNRILREHPYYTTDARLGTDLAMLWMDLPRFDSFVQAVKFLKENLEQLM